MDNFNYKGLLLNKEGKVVSNAMRTNGTLPHEAYIKWDQKMVDVARQRLTFIEDLNKYNLVDRSLNLGDMIANFEKLSDVTEANVSMSGTTPTQKDVLTFTTAGVPVPIFHKGFNLGAREIQAAADRPGRALGVNLISTTTRIVSDKIDDMFWNGVPGVVVDGKQVYGVTNHPNRNTVTISNAWGASNDSPITDVKNMLQEAYNDNFFGPFVLYVSKDNWAFIQEDYNDNKGTMTYKQRMEAFSDIAEVRPGDGLANGEVVLVQMTDDVLELKVAQDLVNYEEPQKNMLQHEFTIMAAMALQVKSDSAGRCGIVHATGA